MDTVILGETVGMDQSVPNCPICGEATQLNSKEIRPYKAGENYRIRDCLYCDLQYVDKLYAPVELYDQIYANSSRLPGYDRYSYFQSEVTNHPDPLRWLGEQDPAYWFIQQEVATLPKTASILEVGSGLGYLSYAIKSKGYDIVGIDISEQAVASARRRFGDIYANKNLFKLADETPRYDLVILTEVIEHVSAPVDFLKAAAAVLKPNGALLVTTPNKSASVLGANWQTESPPVHLWWFSETAIRQLAKRAGMTLRFCDFSPLFSNKPTKEDHNKVIGSQPHLDAAGNVTDDATNWLKSNARGAEWRRRLRSTVPFIARALRNLNRRRYYASVAAERGWQIGVVLKNK